MGEHDRAIEFTQGKVTPATTLARLLSPLGSSDAVGFIKRGIVRFGVPPTHQERRSYAPRLTAVVPCDSMISHQIKAPRCLRPPVAYMTAVQAG
jgi:hypothetical protein